MAETGSPLVRGTLYHYSYERQEWITWERSAQPPNQEWEWPDPSLRHLQVLTWNVSSDPAFAVSRALVALSKFTAIGPDIAGLQEVSSASPDDAGAPGYRGRGFWDVLHENHFVRREYLINFIEEQNVRMFEGLAPFGTVLLLRKRLIANIPQVWLWYYTLESRDYSNLVGADFCDQAGRPWFSVATGQFEADPQEHAVGDAEYALGSRQAQFRAVTEPGGALGRANNVLLLADLSVLAVEESQPFFAAGFTDVYRTARPNENARDGATYGGWGLQLASYAPPGPNARRRQDFVFARGAWLTGCTAELVGNLPLPLGYMGEQFVDGMRRQLRVFPSSHLGVSARLSVGPQQEESSSAGQGPGKRARLR